MRAVRARRCPPAQLPEAHRRASPKDSSGNFDIGDHPIYDGLELQWFDDVDHGPGMLAFLTRWDSHVVDYYAQRGLRVDPADHQLGAGTSVWVETDFADARLAVSAALASRAGGGSPNGARTEYALGLMSPSAGDRASCRF